MQRDTETFAIIGAAMEVYREFGHRFLELVYQTALALEFQERGFSSTAEPPLPLKYKSKLFTCTYRADFICFNTLIVETKAIAQLTNADDAQPINQLKATGFHRGSLLNLGAQVSSTAGWFSVCLIMCENLCNLWTTAVRNRPLKFICNFLP